ncbi:MAG TPA: hypothetical protein VGN57_20860 [Pirellulaceae bacterium]|nr:hypothetical protein [Pirellulaceae bacterium]
MSDLPFLVDSSPAPNPASHPFAAAADLARRSFSLRRSPMRRRPSTMTTAPRCRGKLSTNMTAASLFVASPQELRTR